MTLSISHSFIEAYSVLGTESSRSVSAFQPAKSSVTIALENHELMLDSVITP